MNRKLPKFDNPPIIESVLGVEFETLSKWQLPHFGLYWDRIKHKYPVCSVQPPIPDQLEKFGQERTQIQLNLSVLASPEVRCWFVDKEDSWLLQIQNNRFISNWRKQNSSYPHYKGFWERFLDEWKRFNEYVSALSIEEEIKILQCEVTYINHIDVESSLDDLSEVFPILNKNPKNFLPEIDSLAINTAYVIPENRGRLYIAMQPVFRHSDAKIILQLSVTAKVRPTSNNRTSVREAIDLAHEWVVSGFTDFTSTKMHDIWKRKI